MSAQAWPYPRYVAHRGAGKLAPENTMAAFRLGAEYGYRMFECDAKLRPEPPLRLAAISLDRAEEPEHDARIVRPLVALRRLEHEDIPRSGTATSFIV